MGCVKSKRGDSAEQTANPAADGKARGRSRGEKAHLVHSETDAGAAEGAAGPDPAVNPVLLEYAQRLSEEIVSRAVQQWADLDSRYSDIPYIECDVP